MDNLNTRLEGDFEPLAKGSLDSDEMSRPQTSYLKDVWRNFKKRRTAVASFIILALLVFMVLFGPMMTKYNYYSNDYNAANQPPSAEHWFGTDTLGRDLWTRVWVGGRVSLLIAILATIIPYFIGMVVGGISGYVGGKVDMVIMRVIDILMGIPSMIYNILLIMVLGSGNISTLIIAFTITGWLGSARSTRGMVLQLKARIGKLQNWLKEETENTAAPTLADYIQGILSRKEQAGQRSNYAAVRDLKAAAKMLNFLTANSIKDMAGLEEKVMDMYGEQQDISVKLKPIDRRLKTLDEHIMNAERYMQYRDVYRQYKQQKPKKQEAFYEARRMELTHYEAAERYLKGVMNGKTTLPIKSWKAERDKLNAERQQLSLRYYALKDEVKEVDQIRRGVYNILRQEQREHEPRRAQDMER